MKKLISCILLFAVIACKADKKEKSEEGTYSKPSSEKITSRSPEIEESIDRGEKIYNNFCVTCHLASGEGIPNAFPPLNKSNWLTEKREESIHAVKYGLQGPITVNGESYNSVMTPLGLEDHEVADVMNYIFTAWDNTIEEPATVEEVTAVEK